MEEHKKTITSSKFDKYAKNWLNQGKRMCIINVYTLDSCHSRYYPKLTYGTIARYRNLLLRQKSSTMKAQKKLQEIDAIYKANKDKVDICDKFIEYFHETDVDEALQDISDEDLNICKKMALSNLSPYQKYQNIMRHLNLNKWTHVCIPETDESTHDNMQNIPFIEKFVH